VVDTAMIFAAKISPNADMTLALDIGATSTKAGIARNGLPVNQVFSDATLSVATSPQRLLEHASSILDKTGVASRDIVAVNLAVHGQVADNRIVKSTRLPWFVGLDFAEIFGERFNYVINDAHAAALGVRERFIHDLSYPACSITLGTGVGIAVLEDANTVSLPEDLILATTVTEGGDSLNLHQYLGFRARQSIGLEDTNGAASRPVYSQRVLDGLTALVRQSELRYGSIVILGGASRHISASLLAPENELSERLRLPVICRPDLCDRIPIDGLCHFDPGNTVLGYR
jgi:hypothetical protein